MKLNKKSILFLATIPLLLTACNFEKKCFCLETSNSLNFQDGYCYQLSKQDILETIFVSCLPSKSENDTNENYYEITWKKNYSFESFSFTGGLKGKQVKSIVRIEDSNTLRINVSGACLDQEATSGYLRISGDAFDSHSEKSQGSVLYAYFAIGEKSDIVVKPGDISF